MSGNDTSRIPGFYKLSPDERVTALQAAGANIVRAAWRDEGLRLQDADLMVENVIGTFSLPNAVAVNFCIDGIDRLVPMVVEEPSVVAAVSNMARLARRSGGFVTEASADVMIGQLQLTNVQDPAATVAKLEDAREELLAHAAGIHPRLVARGGGIRGIDVRHVVYDEPGFPREDMVVLHIHLDCVDAMGANMVNTVVERLAPLVEGISGEQVGLKILSNLADQRLARATVRIDPKHLSTGDLKGEEVAERIASAWRFAWADPYRAATHNKGVMNGIDAVALATGNDWRAIEAGAHAWCARDGHYRPMTTWRYEDGALVGTIEVPVQFGTVGGTIRVHPTVQANLALLGAEKANDLARVAVAVGLAQNLGALKALATEGIQAGHMRMHARTVAATAGATTAEVPRVATALCAKRDYSVAYAERVLGELRGG
ncbi:MAG: hydroxymethylglutaryl-CoA reductase [Myxococcota bacterium]